MAEGAVEGGMFSNLEVCEGSKVTGFVWQRWGLKFWCPYVFDGGVSVFGG